MPAFWSNYSRKIFADSELQQDSVIRKFRITAADGKSYDSQHYSLPAIIAVGYKVNSERAVQFRKWAAGIIEQFTIKANVWTMLMYGRMPKLSNSLLDHCLNCARKFGWQYTVFIASF